MYGGFALYLYPLLFCSNTRSCFMLQKQVKLPPLKRLYFFYGRVEDLKLNCKEKGYAASSLVLRLSDQNLSSH